MNEQSPQGTAAAGSSVSAEELDALRKQAAERDQFRELATQGLDAQSIYQVMANQDIGDVLDLFRPIYDRTHRVDGYVSLEVSPLLAYETEQTIAEARQLWAHLNRPNLFIKIPAVAQGIAASGETPTAVIAHFRW